MSSSSQSTVARKMWEMENRVMEVASSEDIYKYDRAQQQSMLAAKPWEKDPHFFKDIKISALALLKMVMHARSGGNLEIMGLLLGKVDANVMVVMDSFALPVEGTETRVNAQAQGYEYMTEYIEAAKKVGRLENAIGWYHSHPGYGCWLSGIDVSTQMLNQNFQDPFVAIVVDPVRTISAGKVNLGAFRTYPKVSRLVHPGTDRCHRRFPPRFPGLQASGRGPLGVPDHPAQQNRGLRRPLQVLLLPRGFLLQIPHG